MAARYDQCDETCTTDCGHCKGAGPPPVCCGQPMYECHAEHTDGKRYLHCRSCTSNREVP